MDPAVQFPQPTWLSSKTPGWREDRVDAWEASRPIGGPAPGMIERPAPKTKPKKPNKAELTELGAVKHKGSKRAKAK